MATRNVKTPEIPQVGPSSSTTSLARAIMAIKELLEIREGKRKNIPAAQRYALMQDVLDAIFQHEVVLDKLVLNENDISPKTVLGKGQIYTKQDDKLYFKDGGGTEHEIAFV